jgi:hypothetical protein
MTVGYRCEPSSPAAVEGGLECEYCETFMKLDQMCAIVFVDRDDVDQIERHLKCPEKT